ncbi:Aste57867_14898 [Aphanomyces stellatus]|uniref:Aste57867_14898 protein n=1 Tax=Aphanomyces stellatus TaxID=120398 RepID=A0A485L1W0_9STRA|nr:hypothetical protein As57867_014842 [Aphanomyces stellatus]VFT91714.1 Aste57867_14898 [Aphanomyces stellatus]
MDRLERRDRIQRQREYDRHKKQLYRQKERSERNDLLAEIDELTRVLTPMMEQRQARDPARGSRVAWSDICKELRAESALSVAQNTALKTQVKLFQDLVLRMKIWVARNSSVVVLDGRVPTWRDVSLLAQPRSRQLGKEWITKNMFHQADAIFHSHGFPAKDAGDDFFFDVTFDDGGVDYVLGCQNDLLPGWEQIMALLCPHLCAFLFLDLGHTLPMNTVKESDGAFFLHQMTSTAGEFFNLLATTFHDGTGGSVVVAQSIDDDELAPRCEAFTTDRKLSLWADIYCLPHGQWKRRTVVRQRRTWWPGIAFEDEARYWGCDLTGTPQGARESVFRNHAVQTWHALASESSRFQRIRENI